MQPHAEQSRTLMQSLRESLPHHIRKVWHFGLVSGAGLILDIALFLTLLSLGVSAFLANLASSAAAVSFVYAASVRRVFRYRGRFLFGMFAAYGVYQCAGILAGSWAVQALVRLALVPAAAKIAILPVTFSANYLFMQWLTSREWRQ